MIHGICDYCFRGFGYQLGDKAICMNCGVENVRPMLRIETATAKPGGERAMKPEYKSRRKIRGRK